MKQIVDEEMKIVFNCYNVDNDDKCSINNIDFIINPIANVLIYLLFYFLSITVT